MDPKLLRIRPLSAKGNSKNIVEDAEESSASAPNDAATQGEAPGSPIDSPSHEDRRPVDKYEYLKVLKRDERYIDEEKMSLQRNSEQEEIILDYVESFRRQLTQLFPERRPFFTSPFNEYGIRKFVCTSIRPSPQESLWDVGVIADFIADFIEFFPLRDPVKYPSLLPSQLAICHLRSGDCLDMSTLLVSILRGAGYDAYVVSGIASRSTTLRDRRGDKATKFLELSAWKGLLHPQANESEPTSSSPEQKETSPKYKYRPPRPATACGRMKKKSRFDQFLRDGAGDVKEQEFEEKSTKSTFPEFPDAKDRVHFWVMVRAGSRNVNEDIFIESTTGTIWKIGEIEVAKRYFSVDSLWNEKNYWVNLQTDAMMLDMSFSIEDVSLWEFMFYDEGMFQGDSASDGVTGKDGGKLQTELVEELLQLPKSWNPRVELDAATIEDVFPGGKSEIVFKDVTVKRWRPFYPKIEGKVIEVSIFKEVGSRRTCTEIRELFSHRLDKLEQRIEFMETGVIKEKFGVGRPRGLQVCITDDKKLVFWYYPNARINKCWRRMEVFSTKVVTLDFANRTDCLKTRVINFIDRKGNYDAEQCGMNITKFVDVFERNWEKPAREDVRRVEYDQENGTIKVNFHFGRNRIMSSSRVYYKSKKEALVSGHDVKGGEIRNLFRYLLEAEKAAFASIRENEQDFDTLLEVLSYQRKRVQLEMDPYTVARLAVKTNQDIADMKNVKGEKAFSTFDELSMFMPVKRMGKKMSREECFAMLKERLIHRLDILNRRKDRDLKRMEKIAHKSRLQLNSTPEGDTVRMRQVEIEGEAMIKEAQKLKERLLVTEKRIMRHEKQSIEKLRMLNTRLLDHPLL